jgi:hypothetical protein
MRLGWVAGGILLAGAVFIGARLLTHRGAEQGLDLAFRGLPPGFAATHGPVTFDPLTGTSHLERLVVTRDGALFLSADVVDATGIGSVVGGMPVRIGHVTLRDVAAGGPYRHVDRIEIDGLETRNIRNLFDQAAYPAGKPATTDLQPMVASVDTYGAVLHIDPASAPPPARHANRKPFDITVRHGHYAAIAARQFAAAPAFAHMPPAEIAALVLQAVAERSATTEGIEAVIPETGTLSIATATSHGYDGGKLDDAEADQVGFAAAGQNGRATLDRVRLAGLDFTRALAALPQAAAHPDAAAVKMNGALRISRFSLNGLRADFAAVPLLTLDSIDVHTNYASDTISNTTGGLHGMHWVTTGRGLPDKDTQGLRDFGMTDFTLDMNLAGSFDEATGHAVLTHEDFALKDLGTLHFAFDVDGLKFDSNSPAAIQQNMRGIRINHGEIKWNDESLTGRLFKLAAARSGQSEDALRAAASLSLVGLTAYLPDQPDAADQINAFLDGRHSLEITIAPAAPVSVGDLMAAEATDKAHLLGVRIKGN